MPPSSPLIARDGPSICRICLEPDDPSSLCRPCACKGTQAYVHPTCLRRWQETSSLARSICPVCKNAYDAPWLPDATAGASASASPPRPIYAGWRVAEAIERWLTLPHIAWAIATLAFV